jgi:hypothetical protein
MSRELIHKIEFRQGPRSVVLRLRDSAVWPWEAVEGWWSQFSSEPDEIDLHPRFSMEDKKRLHWSFDPSTDGGLIKIGINMTTETKGGQPSKWKYENWISLQGAKRLAHRQFQVDKPSGDGKALFELAGSSNTFDPKQPSEWSVIGYREATS